MKIPFFWLALGFTMGVVIESAVSLSPPWFAAGFLTGLPVLWVSRGKKLFLPLLIFQFVCLGVLYSRAEKVRPPNAVEQWAEADRRCSLEGFVKTQPEIQKKGRRVIVSFVLSSRNLMRRVNGQREFFETEGDVQVFLFQPGTIPDFGDLVRLFGALEKPKPAMNPGQFDYGRYLTAQNVYALFESYGGRSIRILEKGKAPFFLQTLFQLRKKLRERIETLYHGDAAVLFKALILGERKGLSPPLRDEFVKTGTAHLLAISGLNITLVAGSFYLAMIAARIPQKISALLAFWICLIYVVIAGMGIPVQRAGWMAGAGFLALLLERERHVLNFFFLAFWILLVLDPGSLGNVSFQLSFLSVLSLILIFKEFEGVGRWQEFFGASLAATAGTFPLVAYYFNIFSPAGLGANLGAVPLFHLALLTVLISLALGNIPLIGMIFVKTAGFFLHAGLEWIHLWAQCRWGYFFLPAPSSFFLLFYYAAAALFLGLQRANFPYIKWFRSAAAGLWFAAASLFFWPHTKDQTEFTFLAAGRNELAHWQWGRGEHWLLNTGRDFPSDQGRWLVAPYLRSKGINRLSVVWMTDFQRKHTGGFSALKHDFPARNFLYPRAEHPARKSMEKLIPLRSRSMAMTSGDKIQVRDQGEIAVLGLLKDKLIFKIRVRNWNFLYLAAFDEKVLDLLQPHFKMLYDVDFLVLPSLPHEKKYGHKFNLFLEDFFDQVDPTAAVIPHSAPFLKQFLKDRDIALFELDKEGAVTFKLEGKVEIFSFLNGRIGEGK